MSRGERSSDPQVGPLAEAWSEAKAQAKVNLRLRISPPGPDGYHPLETIFCRIDLADRVRLRLRRDPGIGLRVSGPEPAPEGPENLAARAAALLLERVGLADGVEIELQKHVPPGAGLGGGSSDAAAALRLLAGRLARPPGREELLQLAAELGSDVPFFLADAPMALGWGRGDRLLCLPPAKPRPMLLLLPGVAVATEAAYAIWDECRRRPEADLAPEAVRLDSAALSSWSGLRSLAENDFEPVILARYPRLRSLLVKLRETGPLLALLAGSGAALFAVYGSARQRNAARAELSAELRGVRVLSVRGPV